MAVVRGGARGPSPGTRPGGLGPAAAPGREDPLVEARVRGATEGTVEVVTLGIGGDAAGVSASAFAASRLRRDERRGPGGARTGGSPPPRTPRHPPPVR